MKEIVFTVHELNEYVKALLSRDPILRLVKVRGEISNFKYHYSGHMYFTLKDDQDMIKCVFFRHNNQGLSFNPSDGDKVAVIGYVSIYGRDGQYQLYVESMEKDGVGDLYKAFEALKKKLSGLGLFDNEIKKRIPRYPKKIAVLTSHTGAAVRDIINIITRRNNHVDILVVPVAVQGKEAHCQICDALDYVNTRDDIDLIILGRGGGSIEDLWAFNEEDVAYAIYRSRIPVISAVGHETDFTIADFVADLRAPTPSAAGELAVPEYNQVLAHIEGLKRNLQNALNKYLEIKRKHLEGIKKLYVFRTPEMLFNQHIQRLDLLSFKLNSSFVGIIKAKKENFSKAAAALNALSPLKIFERGYSYAVSEETNENISSTAQLKSYDKLRLYLKDGYASCIVNETTSDS